MQAVASVELVVKVITCRYGSLEYGHLASSSARQLGSTLCPRHHSHPQSAHLLGQLPATRTTNGRHLCLAGSQQHLHAWQLLVLHDERLGWRGRSFVKVVLEDCRISAA